VTREHAHDAVAGHHDRGVPRGRVEQGELAEVVALAEGSDVLPVARDVGGALEQDVELVADGPLGQQRRAVSDDGDLRAIRDHPEITGMTSGEQRHRLEARAELGGGNCGHEILRRSSGFCRADPAIPRRGGDLAATGR
jgi:hypothetical protein